MIHVISDGGGVQSTTVKLMAAHGLITPMPDLALMADPKAERILTDENLRWLGSPNVLPYPQKIVTAGSIIDNIRAMARGDRWASIPCWVRGADGREAPIIRQCTKEFKLEPVLAELRRMVGLTPGQSFRHGFKLGPRDAVPVLVTEWICISRDEQERAVESDVPWIVYRYPLLEMGWTRQDCVAWLIEHEYPVPPKSSCVFCPFMENELWRRLSPEEWAIALEVDDLLAQASKTHQPMFLHRSLKRLRDVDFTDLFYDAGGMKNECRGRCGT